MQSAASSSANHTVDISSGLRIWIISRAKFKAICGCAVTGPGLDNWHLGESTITAARQLKASEQASDTVLLFWAAV